ncbi:MAG: 8-amino-7-oxononanoate synthase [Steroidobacteraceae bacterium]
MPAPDPAAGLAALEAAGLRRRRRVVEPGHRAGTLKVDGLELVDFSSNDYLGLARDSRLAEAMADSARRDGAGSGASHLVTGHRSAHHALEERLAAWCGREQALLFSTGYMANLGLASALVGSGDRVLEDRLNHASLLDAGLLSRARFARYAHADSAALERRLERPAGGRTLVLTDGVFSMDGDVAPLPGLAAACRRHDALLAVDDAHGLGVIGPTGRGSLEQHGLGQQDVPLLVGTLGKAFGSFGAFVAGPAPLIDWLIQRARTYLYTTALPPPVAATTLAALDLADQESWRRERCLALTQRFRAGALRAGLALTPSVTPIQPVIVGDATATLAASAALQERGFLVVAIRPPTVPLGSARLRVTLSAALDEADVDGLVAALAEVLPARQSEARHHAA